MTEDDKRTLINFFGSIHAQGKQTDQMVVGNSVNLRPISIPIQNQLEEVLRQPITEERISYEPQEFFADNVPEPVALPPVDYQPPTIIQPPPQVVVPASDSLIDVLSIIGSNLERIANILEKKYESPKPVKSSKTKNTESC
jgi:hypothetical protein